MNTFAGSAVSRVGPWLLGALTMVVLSGCALTKPPPEPPDPDAVDVGYGTADKDHVTGSVASFRMDDQPVVHTQTLADMLARIPGVQVVELPGGNVSVRIRGTNSFMGGEEPLWVIDGMVVTTGGGLDGINPSTIESVTVLKDAGSTAIYGSRGANGVILIKTKKR